MGSACEQSCSIPSRPSGACVGAFWGLFGEGFGFPCLGRLGLCVVCKIFRNVSLKQEAANIHNEHGLNENVAGPDRMLVMSRRNESHVARTKCNARQLSSKSLPSGALRPAKPVEPKGCDANICA